MSPSIVEDAMRANRIRCSVALLAFVGAVGTCPAFAQQQGGSGLRIDVDDGAGARRADRIAIDGGYRVWRDWGLTGRYATGNRFRAGPAETLPASSLGMRDESYALGIFKAETWARGDRIALSVGQPLRGDAFGFGTAGLGAGLAGVPAELPAVGLRAPGRELQTELSYWAPLWKGTGLGFSLANRTRSSFDGPLPDERSMSIRFSSRF
jgi:hypothetical protein